MHNLKVAHLIVTKIKYLTRQLNALAR